MGWTDLFERFREAKPETGVSGGDESTVASTPIRGFTVLGLAYPNHLHSASKPLTAYDIALRLCHDLDVEWFGNDLELKHFSVSEPICGNAENEEAFGFDFGPFEKTTQDFRHRYTAIVRETAGGGFMLLIQDSAAAFADNTRTLFEAIVADTERENPEMPEDRDEPNNR
jgi:hypothetical protein